MKEETNTYDNARWVGVNQQKTAYATVADFSARFLHGRVAQEDWEWFYRRYTGFIIGCCLKHNLRDQELITGVIEKVVERIAADDGFKDFKEHRGAGSFRAWFRQTISWCISDVLRRQYRKSKIDMVGAEENVLDSFMDDRDDESAEEQRMWDEYLTFLAVDEVAAKSDPKQINCFIWRICYNRKPAEIATLLGMTAPEVSEAVRSFKDKICNAMKRLGESIDMDSVDWKELKQKADAAKEKYLKEADNFTVRMQKNELRGKQ